MSVEIHPTAIIDKGAELADGVTIGPYCIIGEHAKVGARTTIASHVVIEAKTARSGTSPTWADRRTIPATRASPPNW